MRGAHDVACWRFDQEAECSQISQEDHGGVYISLVEYEGNAHLHTRHNVAAGIGDDVAVLHAGEHLEEIFAQAEVIINARAEIAAEQHAAPGVIDERGQGTDADLLGGAEANGERAVVDAALHVGDVRRGVF